MSIEPPAMPLRFTLVPDLAPIEEVPAYLLVAETAARARAAGAVPLKIPPNLYWPDLSDLDNVYGFGNPVASLSERIAVDRALGLFPTWNEDLPLPLELVPVTEVRGPARGPKRWPAYTWVRESYWSFPGVHRSPDLYDRNPKKPSLRTRFLRWLLQGLS